MTREVFVFGTSHSLQCGAAKCSADSIFLLEQEIRRVLSECGIRRIAEEMSDDALREIVPDEGRRTVCQRVAGDDVRVEFIDLGENERAHLSLSNNDIDGIALRDFFARDPSEPTRLRDALNRLCDEVRERVWVARVLSGNEWPVLFVCGADHSVSVERLFQRVGVPATMICRDFDPDGPLDSTD